MTAPFHSVDDAAALAATYLAQLEPGVQPLALFSEIARLFPLPTVEVSLLREADGDVEVLLSRRPASCPWWPGQLHVPGTVLLATDEDEPGFGSAVQRMIAGEFGEGVRLLADPYCYEARRRSGPRGRELTAFCWAPVTLADGYELPADTAFMNVRETLLRPPAPGLLTGHDETLAGALQAYENRTPSPRRTAQ